MWPRCSHGCQPLLRRLATTKIVWIQVLLKQPQRLKALCGALWRWGQKYYVMNETPSEVAWSMRRRARKCSQTAHKWQHSEPCRTLWTCLFSFLPLQERSLTEQAFRFPTWGAKSSTTVVRQSSWKRNLSTVARSNIPACLRQSLGLCFEIIMRYTRTGTSWKGRAPWSRCTVKVRVNKM